MMSLRSTTSATKVLLNSYYALLLFFTSSYSLSFFFFNVSQLNTVPLQEYIPVQDSEVVLSVEIYHNFRNGVKVFSAKKKVFNAMPT